jgi:hypothetical protein
VRLAPLAVVGVATLCAAGALASPAPHRTWRTLRTGCCDLHYDADIESQARRVAALVDEIAVELEALLDARATERIQITLGDPGDSPQGFGSPVPYNHITLYAIHPDGDDELARTDDWMRLLLTHEMLHVVHLDTQHGLPVLVNKLVGKWWMPNFTLPDWLLEGIATYAETKLTGGGRGRSARWRAALRMAALEGDLWKLDDVSHFSRRRPGGSASRLYGVYFLLWLTEQLGDDDYIARFNHDYASRTIPLAVQRSLEASTGVDIEEAWRAFLADLKAEAFARVREIEARGGVTRTRRLTRMGGAFRSLAFDDDGDLVFVANPPEGRNGLYRIRGLPGAVPVTEPVMRLSGSAWAQPVGGGAVVVSMSQWWWNHWSLRDLFRVDPGQTPRRLSDGHRLRTPAAFADGRRVLVEARDPVRSSVVEVDVRSGAQRELLRFDDGSVAYTPVPSPDSRRFAYSVLRAGGTRDVIVRELDTGVERAVTDDWAEDIEPTWTPDGRWLLYASDRDGIFNLYAWERASGRTVRVTDVVGGATSPRVTPDGRAVVFVGMHLDGEDLYVAELDLDNAPDVDAANVVAAPAIPAKPAPLERESEPYNPLPTLAPRNWVPVLATDQLGGSAIGFKVEGEDAVAKYRFALDARYGTATGRPRLSGNFVLADLFFPVTFNGIYRTDFNVGARRDTEGQPAEQVEQVARVGASLSLPARRWLRSHNISLGYAREWHFVETGVSGRADELAPRYPPPADLGWLNASWSYSSDERYRSSISDERGFDAAVRARISNEMTLSALDLYEFSFDVRAFHELPYLRGHALATYLSGGVAMGNRQRRANWRLGGFGDRDLTQDAIDGVRFGGGQLRGYPANADVGDSYLLGSLEYRFPIVDVERGIGTMPFFVSRVHGAVYGDLGDAFDGVFQPRRLRAGVGAELRAQLLVGWKGLVFVRAGFARGVMRDGVEQPYLVLGVPY